MTRLKRYLENTRALAPELLEAAWKRRAIYGGSLDTILLETNRFDPITMGDILSRACGLPLCPLDLLERPAPPPHPASNLSHIVDAPIVRLGDDQEHHIGVHPDISDEALRTIYRAKPDSLVWVVPQCCLEAVVARRARTVAPQRYAILDATFRRALADASAKAPQSDDPEDDGPPAPSDRRSAVVRSLLALEEAPSRAAMIAALGRGLVAVSARVAIFRIRSHALATIWCHGPDLHAIEGRVIELLPRSGLRVALNAGHWSGKLEDTSLQQGLALPTPFPCLLERVDIGRRPALAVYLDEAGNAPPARAADELHALCTATSAALERLLRRRLADLGIARTQRPKGPSPPQDGEQRLGSSESSIDSPSMRGRIQLNDEDWTHPHPARSDPAEQNARIDSLLTALAVGETEVDAIVSVGDVAFARLPRLLPGPLEITRRDLGALPPPSSHGPLIRAAIRIGAPIVPHLLQAFEHVDAESRFYLAFIFQELRAPMCMPELAKLAFDPFHDVRVISMRVLETYSRSQDFEAATATVRAALAGHHVLAQLYAARAVGTLRDTHAIDMLVELLGSDDRFIQDAALESLCSVTGQQHGRKPHGWSAWHVENRHRHRIEWIIDSLNHRDLPVRRWAHDELIRVTGHRIPFAPLGDRSSRTVAANAWLHWWTTMGRSRFAHPAEDAG